ncbi:coiled-coil domain-containing protein 73-like [Limanda limanda]|uniref:coiled-coil domain-containing protein 73-like n=1 Tax=Limanda limanda TaxID=27771 RepID=UPI0029C79B64|nr:coiled-coil domain-containing protein 73-like [Limanda limanda]
MHSTTAIKDAETHFEDQISKLVLEKQELEWERESLQHQIETGVNQHTESLTSVKNQFQAKIRNVEEEKGKYQVSAELKDKEINNLKEELRSLQLLKFNLEKKSKELVRKNLPLTQTVDRALVGEQKLSLQSRSKDSHLNQLGEVEKRFSALSRQCAMVKKGHETLQQNVDEAMRINKKLTSANEKQEANIVAMKKELEQVNTKLIKTKMMSVTHDKFHHGQTGTEQHVEKLHQRLRKETEIIKKLQEENVAVRAEKQALKQEHEVMRDKSKALEDKVARLMECHAASVTSWDKEKKVFLDDIESERQELRSAKEAFDELHEKHTEVSLLSKEQAQHILELETRNQSRSRLSDSTQVVLPIEPSDELLILGRLQHAASSQRRPEGLDHTGSVTELVATGATEELQQDGEDVQGEDAKDGRSTAEKRGTLMAETTGPADGREDGQRSAEEAEDTRSSEGETRDEGSDGAEQRGKTGEQTPAAQIPTQTSTDCSSEKSNTLQVVDFMDAETPLVVSEPSHRPESRCQESTEQDADSTHVNKGCGTERGQFLSALGPNEGRRSENHGPESVTQVRQVEVQTPDAELLTQLPNPSHQVSEKTPGETPADESAAEPLSDCGSAVLPSAAQTDFSISISELETTAAQSEQNNPSGFNRDVKQTDESSHKHASEECELVRASVEPQPFPQSQEISEQEKGQSKSLILDEDDSGAKSERQANVDTQENCDSEIIQMKDHLKDVCVDITMDTEDVESGKRPDQTKNDKPEVAGSEKTNRSETHLKTSVPSAGPRSSFDLVSVLHQFAQGSEQNKSLNPPPSRFTMFPTSKHSKVPLVITGASDLLNASSVSGNTASSARQRQGEWKVLDQTTAAETVSNRTCGEGRLSGQLVLKNS